MIENKYSEWKIGKEVPDLDDISVSLIVIIEAIHEYTRGTFPDCFTDETFKKYVSWLENRLTIYWRDTDDSFYALSLRNLGFMALDDARKYLKNLNE